MVEAPFNVSPLPRFGAEIAGVDLREPFHGDLAGHLRAALARFQILVFRGQSISPAEQTRVARELGPLEPGIARRPEGHQVAGHPEVLYLSNEPGSPTVDYGVAWHSDGLAYAKVPHGATMLHCKACPVGVGDTLFANQYDAFAAMSRRLQEVVTGLYWHLPRMPYSEVPLGEGLAQPMARIHPVTGRPFLFCAPTCEQIRGMTRRESRGLLDVVHDYQTRPDVVYRHSWRVGDVVVWENCALLHNRADVVDFARHGLRAMHRSATAGSYAAFACEAAEEAERAA